jgi:hypothetical protein
VWPKHIAISNTRDLAEKWMVWGQIFDPKVNQDTTEKLFPMALYWCHKNMMVPM